MSKGSRQPLETSRAGVFLLIIVSSCRIKELQKQYPSAYKPFHAGSPTKIPTSSGMGQVEISGFVVPPIAPATSRGTCR